MSAILFTDRASGNLLQVLGLENSKSTVKLLKIKAPKPSKMKNFK